MKWKFAAVLASFLMVAMAFAVIAAAGDNANVVPELSAPENGNIARADFDNRQRRALSLAVLVINIASDKRMSTFILHPQVVDSDCR